MERGALLIEDFEAPEMNPGIWRLAHRNPDRTTIIERAGCEGLYPDDVYEVVIE